MTEENTLQEEAQTDEGTATAVAEPETAAEPFDDHFRPADIDGFTADDTEAGSAIGKMLAWFFLYTVIVMSISAWWTFSQNQ